MKLLVLGGSGFVSGTLVRMALAQGHEVWSVTRGQRSTVPGVHTLTADRNDAEALRAAVMGENTRWDAVLDCICFTAEQARVDMDVFAAVTDRLIVISTDSVYHPAYKKVPQNEDGECYLTDGGYGAKKREMELALINECPASLKWTAFRPGHIFGPGSLPGCFPEQSRQKDLLAQMRAGSPMRLIGGGDQYLIHPIFAGDLARVMLDAIPNEKTYNTLFCIGGPDVVTNRHYFEILAGILGVDVTFETIPEEGYLEAHPEYSGHLCQRSYDLSRLAATGIALPDTTLEDGLRQQVEYLVAQGY